MLDGLYIYSVCELKTYGVIIQIERLFFQYFAKWSLSFSLNLDLWGSPIGFFNPVIPTKNFVQFRNPEDYFGPSNSRAYFQSRILPNFALKSRIPSFK